MILLRKLSPPHFKLYSGEIIRNTWKPDRVYIWLSICATRGGTAVQWLALLPHSKKVLPPTIKKRAKLGLKLTGHSKFPFDAIVSLEGCLSHDVTHAINW